MKIPGKRSITAKDLTKAKRIKLDLKTNEEINNNSKRKLLDYEAYSAFCAKVS